jgi:aldehyde dehydrogenase (NAD+)
MREHLKFYIDGDWVEPVALKTLKVENPGRSRIKAPMVAPEIADAEELEDGRFWRLDFNRERR